MKCLLQRLVVKLKSLLTDHQSLCSKFLNIFKNIHIALKIVCQALYCVVYQLTGHTLLWEQNRSAFLHL